MLDRRRTEYATAYDDEQLAEQLLSVGDRLEHLAKQGVEIILYEIPIHEELCDAPRARQLRAGVFRAFSGKYRILPTPDCSRYRTTDGHHLNEASATTFAAWVEDHFNR